MSLALTSAMPGLVTRQSLTAIAWVAARLFAATSEWIAVNPAHARVEDILLAAARGAGKALGFLRGAE